MSSRQVGSHLELDQKISTLVKELAKKDAEARELRIDLQFLEDAEAMNLPSEHPGGARQVVPAEEATLLMQSRNEFKAAFDERKRIQKSKDERVQQLAETAAVTDILRSEIDLMYEAACWKPGDVYGYVNHVKVENEVEEYRRLIGELLDAKALEERDLALQTQQLNDLSKEYSSMLSAEEDLFIAQTELKALHEQMKLADEEILSLRRIFQRKQKMVEELESKVDESFDLRALEAEKRLSASKLAKHKESIRQNDVMIRNQAMRIQKLEDKIELIGEAIRGDEGQDVERVGSDTLLEVQRSIEQLKATASRQSQDIIVLDQRLETSENLFKTLQHQKQVTERKLKHAALNHRITVAQLDQQLNAMKENAERMKLETEKKIERCSKELKYIEKTEGSRQSRYDEKRQQQEKKDQEESQRRERLKQSRTTVKAPPPKQQKKEGEAAKGEEKPAEEGAAASEEKKAAPEEKKTTEESKKKETSTTAAKPQKKESPKKESPKKKADEKEKPKTAKHQDPNKKTEGEDSKPKEEEKAKEEQKEQKEQQEPEHPKSDPAPAEEGGAKPQESTEAAPESATEKKAESNEDKDNASSVAADDGASALQSEASKDNGTAPAQEGAAAPPPAESTAEPKAAEPAPETDPATASEEPKKEEAPQPPAEEKQEAAPAEAAPEQKEAEPQSSAAAPAEPASQSETQSTSNPPGNSSTAQQQEAPVEQQAAPAEATPATASSEPTPAAQAAPESSSTKEGGDQPAPAS